MHSIIPNGRYIATLVRRNSALKDGRGGVEYTFRVTHGDYEGSLVSMRLWAPGRLRRADGLSTSQSIEIVVAHRVAASGRRYAMVHDFKPTAALTAADAVRGEDEAPQRQRTTTAADPPGTVQPHPLVTEYRLEQEIGFFDESLEQRFAFPILDEDTAENVVAASRSCDVSVPTTTPMLPDYLEAEEDVDTYRWGIIRTGEEAPVAAGLSRDEFSLPLPRAAKGVATSAWATPFRYTDDLPSYMAAHRQSVRGYAGVAWSCWLPIRLLAEDGLSRIHERAKLVAIACSRLGVPREQIIVVNSGNEALTLFIPSCAAEAAPQVGYEKVAGHFAQVLVDFACIHTFDVPTKETLDGLLLPKDPRFHARIDRQLYGPVAVHPAFNSPVGFGNRFAVALSYQELVSLKTARVESLARSRRQVPRPTWRAHPVEELVSLWEYAVEAERLRSKRYAWLLEESTFVHADTFDFMHHGTDSESAPKRLYRAAVNLMRLGVARDAVVALLHPGADLSGLDRESVEWRVNEAAKSLVPEGFYFDGE